MGCCGSKKVGDHLSLEKILVYEAPEVPSSRDILLYRDEEEPEEELDRHLDENQFFSYFFSAIDYTPPFQGVLSRWQSEVQNAKHVGDVDWHQVWKSSGYIHTLKQMRSLIEAKRLTQTWLRALGAWSEQVVKRRQMEYTQAWKWGKADAGHFKVLETWKELHRAVQGRW